MLNLGPRRREASRIPDAFFACPRAHRPEMPSYEPTGAPMNTVGAHAGRVLIVDDDAEMRHALGLFFSSQGHECELVADAASALGVLERQTLDAVICDVRMEGMNGLELL